MLTKLPTVTIMKNSYFLGYLDMSSQKPRIALTVDDDLNDLLERLSKLTKQPKTRIITDMLKDAQPHLQELANALEMVQDKQNSHDAIAVLSRLSAVANQQVSVVNSEMAKLYSEKDND